MMNYDGEQVSTEFQEAFDRPITDLTTRQMWWIIKIAKHIRGRCRSNAALMNYLNRNFKHLRFEERMVTKEDGETYKRTEVHYKDASRGFDSFIDGE